MPVVWRQKGSFSIDTSMRYGSRPVTQSWAKCGPDDHR
jgi:hypothetical protein